MQNFKEGSKNIDLRKLPQTITKKFCNSFVFNTNQTILFISNDKGEIKQYCFNSERKLLSTLIYNPFKYAICLVWQKKLNSLISGHKDEIVVWKFDKYNQLRPLQILKFEEMKLGCIILNQDEDILMVGCLNAKIQFWKKVSEAWICSQIISASINIDCLSFIQQNKLVLYGGLDKYIQVMEYQKNENWIIIQTIYGYDPASLCFINDDSFAFKPCLKDYLEIYDYDFTNNQFVNTQQVQIQSSDLCIYHFPSQYITEKNDLVIKQGQCINYFSNLQYMIGLNFKRKYYVIWYETKNEIKTFQ